MKKFDGYLSQISSILIGAYSHGYEEGFEKAKARFGKRERPAADVAPVRHGRWKCNKPCPVCGGDRFEGLDADIWADWEPPYCPNCGAKMDGGAE